MSITKMIFAVAALGLSPGALAVQPDEAPLAIKATDPALKWGACPPIFPGKCEIAVLHGDPGRPNADVFLRVAGGYELPTHTHSSAERMILVGGQLRIQYRGSKPFVLSVGDYAFGPAGAPHRASCIGDQPCTLFIAFEGAVDALPFAGKLD